MLISKMSLLKILMGLTFFFFVVKLDTNAKYDGKPQRDKTMTNDEKSISYNKKNVKVP